MQRVSKMSKMSSSSSTHAMLILTLLLLPSVWGQGSEVASESCDSPLAAETQALPVVPQEVSVRMCATYSNKKP